MNLIRIWWMAFRPKTLTAAVVPVFVGHSLLYLQDIERQKWITLLALLGALFIQIGTNLFNDAIDFEKGADTEDRVGPKRVTQSGLVSAKSVRNMALASFVLAFLCGVPLVIQGGWVIVLIGLASLAAGYAYTGGPFPLAYKGWGDFFVILFFGLVAVGGTFYLHTHTYNWDAVVAGLQVGFLGTVLIAINNLRDIEGDAKVGKKTLAVRFGKEFVRKEILILIGATFLLNLYWWEQKLLWTAVLPLFFVPLARKIIVEVQSNEPGPEYNSFLAQAAQLHMGFGAALALGICFG